MTGIVEHAALQVLKRSGSALLADFQRKKAEEARQALMRAMSKGKVWRITENDAAAAMFAYMRAAEEGAARLNLEMIAEAFANAAQEPTFAPDTFRRYTRLLADLSREEIIVIAQLMKSSRAAHAIADNLAAGWITENLREALVGPGKFFTTEYGLEQHLGSLLRTGVVIARSAWGGMVFRPTSLLIELERLVDFDRARTEAEINSPAS